VTPLILRFDALASTNDTALDHAQCGAAEGLCVAAREQTAGRGRQQREWSSPPGAGLYLSVVLRPRLEANHWPLITFAAALAVRDALRETCGLTADIKWPNDLHAGGRKLCGILAETCDTPQGRACVLGVGVNLLARDWPPELREIATSVEDETGKPPDAEAFLAALLRALQARYAALGDAGGAAQTIADWAAASSYAYNRRVRVNSGGEVFDGTTRGLEPDGALRVELVNGAIEIVRAGDVTALRSVPGITV
jgi:BirA family biotin operon repressor/biotin-[acetyl-CoA-carboxylase] ligase